MKYEVFLADERRFYGFVEIRAQFIYITLLLTSETELWYSILSKFSSRHPNLETVKKRNVWRAVCLDLYISKPTELCVISGFHCGVNKSSLVCYSAFIGNSLPRFMKIQSVLPSRITKPSLFACLLKIRPIYCPEMLVRPIYCPEKSLTNYQQTLRNSPEKRRYHPNFQISFSFCSAYFCYRTRIFCCVNSMTTLSGILL